MKTEDKIKKQIEEIKKNNEEIKKEIEDPNCSLLRKAGKRQSIKYGEEMILDFEKVLEGMNNGK